MHKFPKIGHFKNAMRYARKYLGAPWVPYLGTVKVHGTNAGVYVAPDGTLTPQSRNRVLTLDSDNMGWAKFVHDHAEDIRRVASLTDSTKCGVVLYGEWCGPGIQQKVGVCELAQPVWYVFGACHAPFDVVSRYKHALRTIPRMLSSIDVDTKVLCVDFASSMGELQDALYEATMRVERECPVARHFGVQGIGEGLVWTPLGEHQHDTDLWFKTKGEAHSDTPVKRVKRSQGEAPQDKLEAYFEACLTEDRLRQGLEYLREMGMPTDEMISLGEYIRWVSIDLKTETECEREEFGLSWQQVRGKVGALAKAYYMRQL